MFQLGKDVVLFFDSIVVGFLLVDLMWYKFGSFGQNYIRMTRFIFAWRGKRRDVGLC